VAFGSVGGGAVPIFCFLCAYVVVVIVVASPSLSGACAFSPLSYGDATPREFSLVRGMILFLCWRSTKLVVFRRALVDVERVIGPQRPCCADVGFVHDRSPAR